MENYQHSCNYCWKYINIVPLWIKPCQKYQTVVITFNPTFVKVTNFNIIILSVFTPSQTIKQQKYSIHLECQTTQFHCNHGKFLRNENRMRLGGMDKQVDNNEKLTTGLQCVVTWAIADSTLLAICIAVSFSFVLYEQTHSAPFVLMEELQFPLHCQLLSYVQCTKNASIQFLNSKDCIHVVLFSYIVVKIICYLPSPNVGLTSPGT